MVIIRNTAVVGNGLERKGGDGVRASTDTVPRLILDLHTSEVKTQGNMLLLESEDRVKSKQKRVLFFLDP